MKAPGDSTLQALWRKVVRSEWGNRCAFYDARFQCDGPLECHHIVKRSRPHLKHVPTNGILLCKRHHNEADSMTGRVRVVCAIGQDKADWLADMERKLFKDYLIEVGKSRAEYLCDQKAYLEKLVKGVE